MYPLQDHDYVVVCEISTFFYDGFFQCFEFSFGCNRHMLSPNLIIIKLLFRIVDIYKICSDIIWSNGVLLIARFSKGFILTFHQVLLIFLFTIEFIERQHYGKPNELLKDVYLQWLQSNIKYLDIWCFG